MVEHFLDVEGVTGPNPVLSTKFTIIMAKSFIETQVDFVKSVKLKDLKQDQRIGILGALIILISAFMPVVKYSYLGISYQNSIGLVGWIIALSAVVSGYLLLYPKIKYVIISNLVASVSFIYAFFMTFGDVSQRQKEIDSVSKFAMPYGNMSSINLGTVEIQWLTWLLMLAGIAAVFYSVKSNLKGFYTEMKTKAEKIAQENRKSEVVEVEPKKKEEAKEAKVEDKE